MQKTKQIEKSLLDLIRIIQFTENVSTKIHGLLDESKIYDTVINEFAKSKEYTVTLLLLSKDGLKLKLFKSSFPHEKLKAAEKVAKKRTIGFEIDLDKSSFYSRVVRNSETVKVNVNDIVGELFPKTIANLISKIMGYEKKSSILTPIKMHKKIVGALAISSTDFVDYFIPSVRNLAHHISTGLELTEECTKVKETTKMLEESNLHNRLLFEQAPVGIGISNFEGRVISSNGYMRRLTGYSDEELMKINLKDTYKNLEDRTRLFKRLKKEKEVNDFEVELKRKDGTTYWVSLTITPFPLKGQDLLLTVAKDITACKNAQIELAKSETELRVQKEELEHKNIALREVISQIEIEKGKIKEDIETNIYSVISPILERLKKTKSNIKSINLLEYFLKNLDSSYGSKIINRNFHLTQREIEICNMIKGGFANKDIASILNISALTVEQHRKNIRHKLGISNKHINLSSFLRQF